MPYPKGKFACVLCAHDVGIHNLDVGCPACSCAATPGEANHNSRVAEPYDGPIIAISKVRPETHYVTRPVYGKSMHGIAARKLAETIREAAVAEEPPQCPTCLGSGAIAYGRYGKRPPKRRCELCQGTGTLSTTLAEVFRVGVEMGRSSAYLGRYDQYDTGSLMFSAVDSPYDPSVEFPAEVNGRHGF